MIAHSVRDCKDFFPFRKKFFEFPNGVSRRLGGLLIEMLGGNEFRLREVGGFAVGFNRCETREREGFNLFLIPTFYCLRQLCLLRKQSPTLNN